MTDLWSERASVLAADFIEGNHLRASYILLKGRK